jgi:hypothetical protein
MDTLYVQFEDSSSTKIISYFGCPQDPDVWPNQGEVTLSDARWSAYYDSIPPTMQKSLPTPIAA